MNLVGLLSFLACISHLCRYCYNLICPCFLFVLKLSLPGVYEIFYKNTLRYQLLQINSSLQIRAVLYQNHLYGYYFLYGDLICLFDFVFQILSHSVHMKVLMSVYLLLLGITYCSLDWDLQIKLNSL